MTDATYIAERQVEYWTSRQIEEFLLNAGHEILVYPIDQRTERYLPADFLYNMGTSVKMFGIQYKALYHNGIDYWKLDQRQHTTLTNFPWIYYGLSDIKKASDFRNSLHYLRVYENQKPIPDKFPANNNVYYTRWAVFYESLLSCKQGAIVSTKQELVNLLSPYTTQVIRQESLNNIVDVFAFNIESKKTVKFSSQLSSNLDFE
ncbi:hypothetical protein GNE08_12150 [Trichormus variabilis ARAD]|nr:MULTISPECIES: hypothetical protein [Nostocaceae]MBC1214970.1 hypothetical protein [Trichormus variabilis ARAD]MBC1254730.1 hypothetical protein [Trichormus variabilis V5]MBC1266081.1 hypothetical protein [Trichormus variabilis FSR]MBC1303478.1 hypothetical protein [Trichormus variabilis N2B]MBC1312701.1 hypothetical protein [Trichormus variabilis PNB]